MTRWKYDADQNDPLTRLRIPVTSDYPAYTYTACFHRDSKHRPTDAEARMLASFIEEYQSHRFGDGPWRKVQQTKPFDMDCYTTKVFHKWATGDWSYRQVSWRAGPHFVPVGPDLRGTQYDTADLKGPVTLLRVMDHIHGQRGDSGPMQYWTRWKNDHRGVFPNE